MKIRNYSQGLPTYPNRGYASLLLLFSFTLLLLSLVAGCKKDKAEPGACKSGVPPQGHIVQNDDVFIFGTTGGGQIEIKLLSEPAPIISIKHSSYSNFKLEFWGGSIANGKRLACLNHENLNGKHVKDRTSNRRTIVFPDGAKITMISDSKEGALISASIYDQGEGHRIDCKCNVLDYSSTSAVDAQQLDDEEADGETGTFEITTTGLLFFNIYDEAEPGNKIYNRVLIGELDRNNPNQVIDYYP